MNKLEEQFKEIIIKTAELDYNDESDYLVPFVSLTKDVAVKFAEWLRRECSELDANGVYMDDEKTWRVCDTGKLKQSADLFDYFITNVYKP